MTTTDRLGETYVAALQHDLVDVSPDATLVGVARRPTGWFEATVEENHPVLGPPEALLEAFQQRREDFKRQGVCDEGAHNAAWEDVEFEKRYRSYLDESGDARAAVAELVDRLRGGDHLVLVCFENTDQKRCHRTLLEDHLAAEV